MRITARSLVSSVACLGLSAFLLECRYAQREESGAIHRGRSVCQVEQLATGRIRIVELFTWITRSGSGTNVFDETH
jgi:hypothetical protein